MSRYAERGSKARKEREETAVIMERLAYEIATDPMDKDDPAMAERMLVIADRLRDGETLDLADLFSLESGARETHGGELCSICLGATVVCSHCDHPRSQCGCTYEGENGESLDAFDPCICEECGGSGAET
jgi:hypothetical protein